MTEVSYRDTSWEPLHGSGRGASAERAELITLWLLADGGGDSNRGGGGYARVRRAR